MGKPIAHLTQRLSIKFGLLVMAVLGSGVSTGVASDDLAASSAPSAIALEIKKRRFIKMLAALPIVALVISLHGLGGNGRLNR
jgi:hypothetical protein